MGWWGRSSQQQTCNISETGQDRTKVTKLLMTNKKSHSHMHIWTQANVNLRKIYIDLENHLEYPHKTYIARMQSHWATSLTAQAIFIQIFVVGSERRTCFETECVMALQGHPRSLILAPIKSSYVTSWSSILILVLSCPVSEILQVS